MKTVFTQCGAAVFVSVLAALSPDSVLAQTFPELVLLQPTNGAVFYTGAGVKLAASEPDFGQALPTVSFFSGTNFLGFGVGKAGPSAGDTVFSLVWTNAPVGSDEIYAQAARRGGVTNYTRTNSITVLPSHDANFVWLNPTNLQSFPGPGSIQLSAGIGDSNGAIAYAAFFDGPKRIGFVTNGVVLDPPFPPGWVLGDLVYLIDWTNQSIGTHQLTVAAHDTNGQVFTSPALTVFIGSNLPPVVRIIGPPNHSDFRQPVNINLAAYAIDPDGSVASVQFFVGSTNLGFAQPVAPPNIGPFGGSSPIVPLPTNTFVLTWTNPPAGTFDLTAVATDLCGATATSAPVSLSVLPSVTPPPTNYPDVVDVAATDPIAIASTNCWVWRGLTNGLTWSNWISPAAVWRSYTNCGPVDATFTVHRFGATDSNLVVNYSLAGTATNGFDYVTLPGQVTIPVGQRGADIIIVPIDNQSNYIHTLSLTLDPSTNSSPDYVLGPIRKAEGLIIDGAFPHFGAAALLGDHSFHMDSSGPDGAWFHIDCTTNLIDWTTLCTNQVVNGSIDFTDPDASLYPHRLYRIVPLSGPGN